MAVHPSEEPSDSSAALSAEARQREFLTLFSTVSGSLHGFVWCLLPDGDAADEVFQELSYRLWVLFDKYDRSQDFGRWARGVARMLVLEYRRKNHRWLPVTESTLDELTLISIEMDSRTAERRDALRECLLKLAESDRQLLEMRYEERLKPKDIAAAKGRSVHYVYRNLVRVHGSLLACIRRALNES